MMKRMILAGLLAATALPALASDASYDKAAAAPAAVGAKADSAPRPACGCQKHQS
ncbi:hypothetical protein [Anaeromyxobacter diazotrophicus]|uniref:Uncharacterized protein n=1 Tax=Anaeromyxobacter diazotrophicus TaxID=2590199 RepID=A0A7I9VMX5_9BACT|nr:hypothetical protein [Anaeromyxobacter diazotrophicus]GEJ57752.1 hypothetical protein AMYX_24930 [Anaeromyxobacter diazotrophicus]